jgi:hypothetical protein
MIEFMLGGTPIQPDKIADVLMQAAVNQVADEMRQRLGAISLRTRASFRSW